MATIKGLQEMAGTANTTDVPIPGRFSVLMAAANIAHHIRSESQIGFARLLYARPIRSSKLMEPVSPVHMAVKFHLMEELASRLAAMVHDNTINKVSAVLAQNTPDPVAAVAAHSTHTVQRILAQPIRFKPEAEAAPNVPHTR